MRTGHYNHVLMIDDDESLLGIMAIKLQHSGYIVDVASKSLEGFELASQGVYDAIILDVTMPGMSGYDVCKELRTRGVLTPILMLSGMTETPCIVQCLELGADDYLTKPFSHTELVARLQALVRRNHKSFSARRVESGGLVLDTEAHTVSYDDQTALLTKKEVLLLRRLMYEAPESVGRTQLLKDVWEIDDSHTSNRLDVYVRRLRAKLDDLGAINQISTQRGKGYAFGSKHAVGGLPIPEALTLGQGAAH